MNDIISSWQGASVDEVIQRWGYPDSEQVVAGHHLLHWDMSQSFTLPGQTTGSAYVVGRTIQYSAATTPPTRIDGFCRRTLEIRGDRIVGGQWQGDNCPVMTLSEPYSRWRR